jgi:hypothetical protein
VEVDEVIELDVADLLTIEDIEPLEEPAVVAPVAPIEAVEPIDEVARVEAIAEVAAVEHVGAIEHVEAPRSAPVAQVAVVAAAPSVEAPADPGPARMACDSERPADTWETTIAIPLERADAHVSPAGGRRAVARRLAADRPRGGGAAHLDRWPLVAAQRRRAIRAGEDGASRCGPQEHHRRAPGRGCAARRGGRARRRCAKGPCEHSAHHRRTRCAACCAPRRA